jgi:DNA-binding transcriptional LysR family regulator
VGATPHFIESAVAPALRSFSASNPSLDVVLVEQVSKRLVELLEHDEVHLVLGARGLVGLYQTRTLSAIPLTLVPPDGHRFQERSGLEVTELIAEPLLLLRGGFLGRDVFESACQLAHITPSVRQESDSVHTLLALVDAGAGSAVVQANARIGRPAIPLLQGGNLLSVELLAAWNSYAEPMPAAGHLIDAVDSALDERIRSTMTAISG